MERISDIFLDFFYKFFIFVGYLEFFLKDYILFENIYIVYKYRNVKEYIDLKIVY